MRYQQTFNLNFDDVGNPAIAQLWGRSRIKELMNQMVSGDTKKGVEAVTDTALSYQLLSQYTAFVAVSDDVRVDATESSVSVQVPVEMPEGVNYQGIFGNVAYAPARGVEMSRSAPRLSAPELPAPPKSWLSKWFQKPEASSSSPNSESDLYEDPYDITLINPASFGDDEDFFSEAAYAPSAPSMPEEEISSVSPVPPLQIVSAIGLDEKAIELLTKHLQLLMLPDGFSGDLVFEFQVNKGRVRQVVWDEDASSAKDDKVVRLIRRSLLTWRPPETITNTIQLTIRIQT